MTQRTSTTD